jgi:hypothetical protein
MEIAIGKSSSPSIACGLAWRAIYETTSFFQKPLFIGYGFDYDIVNWVS